MNRKTVTVEKGTFRSPLVPIIATLFAVAAVCGLAALGTLFHPASLPAVLHDMEVAQIYDASAQTTWLVLYIGVTAVNCFGTLVLSLGLFLVLAGRHYRGMDLLYNSATGLRFVLIGSGVAALVYFVFKAGRYTFMCLQSIGGMVPLYAMVVMEGLMLVFAWIVFTKLRQFLECSIDTAASIGYTLSAGKLNAPTIPAFSAIGFLIFAIVDVVLAVDRFITFSFKQMNLNLIFTIPVSKEPVQVLSGLSFGFAAIGSVLMFIYLRGYKRKSEQLLLHPLEIDLA